MEDKVKLYKNEHDTIKLFEFKKASKKNKKIKKEEPKPSVVDLSVYLVISFIALYMVVSIGEPRYMFFYGLSQMLFVALNMFGSDK